MRFENEAKPLGRIYEVNAYRIGGDGSRKVGILFNDITERKAAEIKLRAQNERMPCCTRSRARSASARTCRASSRS